MDNVHVLLTGPIQRGNGRYSSVSVCKNVIVSVHDLALDPFVYYNVGIVMKKKGTVEWSTTTHRLGWGICPSVAVVHIGDKFYAIEAHYNLLKRCYYRIGKIDTEGKAIDWNEPIEFGPGRKPKVSACSDSGTVIIVKEESNSVDTIRYHIGTLNIQNMTITWVPGANDVDLSNLCGIEPAIAMSKKKIVVLCRSGIWTLRCIVGTLRDKSITWESVSVLPWQGINPCVSINSDGYVLESHQSKALRRLSYSYGCFLEDKRISWKQSFTHTTGEYPTVSLSDDGYIVEMHASNIWRQLFQAQGKLVTKVDMENQDEGENDNSTASPSSVALGITGQ